MNLKLLGTFKNQRTRSFDLFSSIIYVTDTTICSLVEMAACMSVQRFYYISPAGEENEERVRRVIHNIHSPLEKFIHWMLRALNLTSKSSMNRQQGRKNEHVQQKCSQRKIFIWCCRPNNPQATFVSIISLSNRSIIFIKTRCDFLIRLAGEFPIIFVHFSLSWTDVKCRCGTFQSLHSHIETMRLTELYFFNQTLLFSSQLVSLRCTNTFNSRWLFFNLTRLYFNWIIFQINIRL